VATTLADATSGVGDYSIDVAGAADNNYSFAYVAGNLAITQALLTVTADDQTKVYGEANPTLTVTYSGYVNADNKSFIDIPAVATTLADATSGVGYYSIHAAGGVDDNYSFAYVAGNLAITKAELTATADNKSKVYGTNNPMLTITYSGFVNGDDVTDIDGLPTASTTVICSTDVETYPIDLLGGTDNNYSFNLIAGSIQISKAPIQITAENIVVLFGDPQPTYTFKATGIVCGSVYEELITDAGLITGILDRPYGDAGIYTITPVILNYNPLNYYVESIIPGTLYVNPIVGCNDKIQASDLCKEVINETIDGIVYTTILRFEYTNSNDVPVYIELGSNNDFKTKGNTIQIIGSPPELFQPGVHWFEVKTTGEDLQWQVKTPGCNNFSKSPNGSNADPCNGNEIPVDIIGTQTWNSQNLEVQVYPNPVHEQLTINISPEVFTDAEVDIQVFDIMGKKLQIHREEIVSNQKFELDMTKLRPGIYFVNVMNQSENRTFKVIRK
jgi:hypothetical protein